MDKYDKLVTLHWCGFSFDMVWFVLRMLKPNKLV